MDSKALTLYIPHPFITLGKFLFQYFFTKMMVKVEFLKKKILEGGYNHWRGVADVLQKVISDGLLLFKRICLSKVGVADMLQWGI